MQARKAASNAASRLALLTGPSINPQEMSSTLAAATIRADGGSVDSIDSARTQNMGMICFPSVPKDKSLYLTN